MESLPDLTSICQNYLDNADLKIRKLENISTLNFRPFGLVNEKFSYQIFMIAKQTYHDFLR